MKSQAGRESKGSDENQRGQERMALAQMRIKGVRNRRIKGVRNRSRQFEAFFLRLSPGCNP
jgi:hypothetical protein